MLRNTLIKFCLKLCLIVVSVCCVTPMYAGITALTRLTQNDPLPVYSSRNDYDFLNRCYENDIIDYCEPCDNRFFTMCFSAFRQTAKQGTSIDEVEDTELGNLKGPWNIIGLFYDPEAARKLIHGLDLDTTGSTSLGVCTTPFGVNLILDPAGADPKQEFGFFSVPMKYRKYGVRFDSEVALPLNFNVVVRGGVSHIWQEPEFIDLSCQATMQVCPANDCLWQGPNFRENGTIDTESQGACFNQNFECLIDKPSCQCKHLVIDRIMKRKEAIERILGLALDENLFTSSPFDKTGFEDIELLLNWSRMFAVNKDRCDWPFTVVTPFATLGITIPTSGPVCGNNPFAISLGNNGHFSYGFRGGLNVDFIETLAIGAEAGFTGFNSRNYKRLMIPTNELQSGIFPETALVAVKPGLNWHFAFMISSYRFLDRISSWVQYAVVHHDKNCYDILSPDDPFTPRLLPRKLRDESQFRVHTVNGSLNYEFSPHCQIGFVWQIPVFQQNAYRSTTFLASFQVTY